MNTNPAGYKTFNGAKEAAYLEPEALKNYTKSDIKAHMNYVFCENLQAPTESKGGIVIPDTVKQVRKWCKVLSVGPECSKGYTNRNGERKQLKAGDLVQYGRGVNVFVGDEVHAVTPEHEILVVLPESDKTHRKSDVSAFTTHVFCENLELPTETKGGIVIPDTVKQTRKWCKVLSVGADCSKGYLDKNGERKQLKVGDLIQYHAGVSVYVGDELFAVTPEHNVLVVLPSEET